MRYLFFLALALVLCSCKEDRKRPLDYKGFIKGYELSRTCASDRADDKAGCMAYILGGIDFYASLSHEIGEPAYCRAFNGEDAINTVVGYMRANQDKLSQPGGTVVYRAMEDAYGCVDNN